MIEQIDKYTKEITSKLGNNLEALILVGSYSRGESIEGGSDIEFWAVVKNLTMKKPKIDKYITLGFTTRGHLKRLKPYIYTIEVKKYGKVLYGDKDILSLIPDYSFNDIDIIDGFILLNNRLIEQLILFNKIMNEESVSQYEFDKGYIQLVNALLIFDKKYRSLYPEKIEQFRRLNISNEQFRKRIEDTFISIKQPPELIDKSKALEKWMELREYFKFVWINELNGFKGIKGWLKIAASGNPLRVFIYTKAAKLYFSQGYKNNKEKDVVIRRWEQFIK